ncbi:hypothetical protein A5717_25925 [Mycolicibacterium porcinum]|nr:hypothetical protein A5717_25925 [Mycolicibacterium porcinum]
MALFITNLCAQGMLNNQGLAQQLGANAVLRIYSGTVPANADAALTGTLLAELVLSASPFSGFSDTGSAARATLAAVASDTSANNTGGATTWRLDTAGGVTKMQGECGLSGSGKELILATTSFTAGSTVSVSSGYFDFPEG